MTRIRIWLAIVFLALFSFTGSVFADTNVCPGECQGSLCHNCTGCTCPQACTGSPTGCRPWFGCFCGLSISDDPWADHSVPALPTPILPEDTQGSDSATAQ